MPRVYCTTREAAALLGVSVSTVQNWTEACILEAWKTEGGHRRISRESVLRLLAQPAHQRPSPTASAANAGSEQDRLKILILDDDVNLLRVYQIRLNTLQPSPLIETCSDGLEALVRVGQHCPDVLIADLCMPHVDGFALLRTLKRLPHCQHLQTIVVSALDEATISDGGGLPDGMIYLPKPLSFPKLESTLKEIAALRSRARSVN